MTIEERLQAVEDRLAIIELEAQYAASFDARDGEAWARLFTEDGIYQPRQTAGAPSVSVVQGRAALRDYCASAPYSGVHFLHLPQVTFDGDTARARIHLEFFGVFEAPGNPFLRMAGYYDVAYRRTPEGWRIERKVTTTFARDQVSAFGYLPGSGLDTSG
ncbi:MAG: nuclear transport factor 2 family protein [Acidimicrobiales bacterium]|nr:nuclear transport factor 2 family protein [Acidimicrobiales bacterium]